jgi:hypothetical protein
MPTPFRRRVAVLAPAAFCATLAGCEVELSGLEPVGQIVFQVREVHQLRYDDAGGDPQLAVLMASGAITACEQFRTELGVGPGVVTVHILGTEPFPDCALDAVPDNRVFLPPLSGTSELRIANNGRADRYSLTVTATQIVVSPVRSTFTSPQITRVWRYPVRSTALHCGPAGAAEACATIRSELVAAGFTPLSFGPEAALPVGYELAPSASTTHYVYASEGAFDAAGAQLRVRVSALRAAYPELWVYLLNWRGLYYP